MDYRELVRNKNEFIQRCTQMLCLRGYHNIDVEMPICANKDTNDRPILALREIKVFFWHEEYGYEFEMNICTGNYSPDTMDKLFKEVIEFFDDPIVLRKANIGKEFVKHIYNKGFDNVQAVNCTNDKRAFLYVFKDNVKYYLTLHRAWPREQIGDNEEDNDSIEYSSDDISYYTGKIEDLLRKTCEIDSYQVSFSTDLVNLSIVVSGGWDKHFLTLNMGDSISFFEDERLEVVENIICYWVEAAYNLSSLLEILREDCFHIQQNSRSLGIFDAYKEGYRYEIEVHSKKIIDFDNMEGHAFERFCAEVLSLNGFYNIRVTQGSRDQGIDIIACKDDIQYGIQCKCYSTDIGNKAVQEAYAGKTFYNCDVAVVLTNRYFTNSAIELAKKNRVHLWDRSKLSQFVESCKELLTGNYE